MEKSGDVKIGIVGLGNFGRKYVAALQAITGVRVTWVSALDDAQCQEVAATFDIPYATTDFRQICQADDVDAVIVVTPEAAHREIAVAALTAGKHVLDEKPLATTEEDGKAIVAAAQRSGTLLMPA